MQWDVGIDLGTENVSAATKKAGAVLSVPAALAMREGREAPIFAGEAAYQLYGRTCEGVSVVFPLMDGVLKNNLHAELLLRFILKTIEGERRPRRQRVLMTAAPFSRPVQLEALLKAALDAGATEAAVIRSDAVSAVGAGLNILAPEAALVLDMGAGKITCTLFTLGQVAAFSYLPYGMAHVDERITRSLRTEAGFQIGPKTARDIKHTLGTAASVPVDVPMSTAGIRTSSRLPELLSVAPAPVVAACEEILRETIALCMSVIDNAPEELAADLNDSGIIVTGGGALLPGLDKRLGDALNIPCRIAEAPMATGVTGIYAIMQKPDAYQRLIMQKAAKVVNR